MISIIIRTLLIYGILIISMRLMGKRQIGQLEVSDLVSTLLLSELAAIPIDNIDIPLAYSLVPTIILMATEIFTAALQGKYPKLKNLFSPRPSTLIRMGQPDFKELERCRISADELMIALRRSGTTDISEVAYAILEQDGNISVLPRAYAKPATSEDVHAEHVEGGMYRIVIDQGEINENSISELAVTSSWVETVAKNSGYAVTEIDLMIVDEAKNVQIYTNREDRS